MLTRTSELQDLMKHICSDTFKEKSTRLSSLFIMHLSCITYFCSYWILQCKCNHYSHVPNQFILHIYFYSYVLEHKTLQVKVVFCIKDVLFKFPSQQVLPISTCTTKHQSIATVSDAFKARLNGHIVIQLLCPVFPSVWYAVTVMKNIHIL